MLVAPVFSKYGMILAPLWSCLSNGPITESCCLSSPLTRTAQHANPTTTAPTACNMPTRRPGCFLRIICWAIVFAWAMAAHTPLPPPVGSPSKSFRCVMCVRMYCTTLWRRTKASARFLRRALVQETRRPEPVRCTRLTVRFFFRIAGALLLLLLCKAHDAGFDAFHPVREQNRRSLSRLVVLHAQLRDSAC